MSVMEVETHDNGHGRFCGATLKQPRADGRTTCSNPKGFKTNHVGVGTCHLHLGATPAHQTKARREQAQLEVTRLGLVVATTPAAALSDALARAYGDVLVTGAKVAQLDETGWKQLDAGRKHERPSVWLELYWAALDRYARIADRCTALGIEAAAVSVVQAHGQQVIELIRLVVSALGHDPGEERVVEAVNGAVLQLRTGGEA